MTHEWFDKHGWFNGVLSDACVTACSHAGQCDEDVAHWRKALSFEVPRDMAIRWLREFGAWTVEEMESESDETLAERVLWLACGEQSESGEPWAGLLH